MDSSNHASQATNVNAVSQANATTIAQATNAHAGNQSVSTSTSSTKKKKPASPSYNWAMHVTKKRAHKPYFVEAEHTSTTELVYEWVGNHYSLVGEAEGSARVSKWLMAEHPAEASDAQATACWKFGAKILREDFPLPKIDQTRHVIPCEDVYLEIGASGRITALKPDSNMGMTHTLKLKAGTPAGTEHVLSPLKDGGLFRTFIERALPDPEVRALVQEQCGYLLIPVNYQIAAWWQGEGGTGKSTMLELCKAMQKKVASVRMSQFCQQFGMETTLGATLTVVDDVGDKEKMDEAIWKSFISMNGIDVNRKREKHVIDYRNRSKVVFCSNPLPNFKDRTNGMWRRFCIVQFNEVIPEEQKKDDFHTLILKSEARQVLDWMLEGAQRLVKRGRFLTEAERPQAVQALKQTAQEASDSVREWMRECNVRVGLDFQPKGDVYGYYEAWCQSAHRTIVPRNTFWKAMRLRLPKMEMSNKSISKIGRAREQVHYANVEWGTTLSVVATEPSANSGPPITFDDLPVDKCA